MNRLMLATILLLLARGSAVAQVYTWFPECEPDEPVVMESSPPMANAPAVAVPMESYTIGPFSSEESAMSVPMEAPKAEQSAAAEAAIRKGVQSYIEAFNRRDARAVAAFWSEDGRFITPEGETFEGRLAIQEGFESFFNENEAARIEVDITSVTLEGPDSAVEQGTARVIRPDEPMSETRYVATHAKENGTWKMTSLREATAPPTHHEQLKELAWMIGRWGDQEEDTTIQTDCQWTRNKNFITRSFTASVAGQIELEGTQVIGWDPAEQVIRSWLFDSDGGFGVGVWTRDGDRWTIRMLQVLPDGERASSVNFVTRIDDDTFEWESVNREVGGQILPNIDPVTVVRKPSGNLTYQE